MTGARGVYAVKESGLEFQHRPTSAPTSASTPEAFLEHFRNNFEMRILEQPSEHELVFEMIGIDPSFANALRRILLAEVPTVAIEHVYMWNNSSIIHDEVLAHRLGLIPLNIDARLLEEPDPEDDAPTDRNTVVFRLAVSCGKGPATTETETVDDDPDDEGDNDEPVVRNVALEAAAAQAAAQGATRRAVEYPKDRPYTKHVYSRDLIWVPQGDQLERFESIQPLHDDILIAKLRPGQAIELECHGRVGIGKDHAKFSPVATASYRLMPQIELLEPVYDQVAEELVHVYEPGVFGLVPTGREDPPSTKVKAVLENPYASTMSRNYMRHPQLAKALRMNRIPDHFIFSVESVGMYQPAVLVAEALRVLQGKCQRVMDLADQAK